MRLCSSGIIAGENAHEVSGRAQLITGRQRGVFALGGALPKFAGVTKRKLPDEPWRKLCAQLRSGAKSKILSGSADTVSLLDNSSVFASPGPLGFSRTCGWQPQKEHFPRTLTYAVWSRHRGFARRVGAQVERNFEYFLRKDFVQIAPSICLVLHQFPSFPPVMGRFLQKAGANL